MKKISIISNIIKGPASPWRGAAEGCSPQKLDRWLRLRTKGGNAAGGKAKSMKPKQPKQPKKMGPKKTLVKQPYRCKKCGQPKRGHKCLS